MNLDYINPFLLATHNVFETMLQCELTRGELGITDQFQSQHEVSGIIGLSGEKGSGTVVLSLARSVAVRATGMLLGIEKESIDEDVIDAIGELTNMVAGAAKSELESLSMTLSLPMVVMGENLLVGFDKEVRPLVIPFECDWGPLSLEIGLTVSEALVEA
ncbi:MAG: chemotaxis protein CheX [Pirellulaceae bacterium]|nr:chemotaxis protein CheX [Pirellulaceae bacterium]